MDMRRLGRTDITVSSLCLGTMTFGEQNTRADGFAQMDRALEGGINFFDTAELYAVPPKAATVGRSEEIVGDWFEARNNRDQVILATKVVGRSSNKWFREDGALPKLDRQNIMEAVDGSLTRLKTDYIDLYQIHWPDRKMPSFGASPMQFKKPEPHEDEVPIEETLEVMSELVTAGKIRAIGLSNESSWGAMKYLEAHRHKGLERVHSIQNTYNLVNRTFEVNLAELAIREDVRLLAYSSLAQGYLTGKYLNGALPKGARRTLFDRQDRYEGPGAEEAYTAYVALAKEFGIDPAQMAIAFAASRPFATANIIGATNLEQLDNAIAAADLTITEELENRINELHVIHGNPCP
ncbi:aldo/keto reductase [Pararhizobium sp. IMCC21322]|uniref:aldo/keto reductase n=1 Tax=Pararhizobium sp. IMCC21322 TaxID=3067903 RepID=UPI0027423D9E|nr:aldo/keto reductase [Pararhizobium sp. IMCC21322]